MMKTKRMKLVPKAALDFTKALSLDQLIDLQ